MSGEIVLPVGASAEPDTCGSCKFFKRKLDNGDWYAMNGYCRFTFPPKMLAYYARRESKDGDENRDMIKDSDRCDLYRFSGKPYIVQRRIPPETSG